MVGQLLEGNFFQNYGILIILIVFLVFMLIYSATRRKKDAKMAEDFANNLKVGDKIRTYSGIYGKIISIKDTPNGKVCVIETGEGAHTSYMAVDIFSIYNIEAPVVDKKNDGAKENGASAKIDESSENGEVVEPADAQELEIAPVDEKKSESAPVGAKGKSNKNGKKSTSAKSSAKGKTESKTTKSKTTSAKQPKKQAEPKSELEKIKAKENK